jgi:hypothetical protein
LLWHRSQGEIYRRHRKKSRFLYRLLTGGSGRSLIQELDAGANYMISYEFKSKLSAALKAQLGLMNTNPDSNIPGDETRYRNTGFNLSSGVQTLRL